MPAPLPPFSPRAATERDAPELARLLTELGHPCTAADVAARWPAWTAAGNTALVAPGPGPTLLGLATLHCTHTLHRRHPVGRITALVVDATARGAGLGRRLVAAAEHELRARGCRLIEVTSHLRRAEAHAFYEHLGYERTGYRFACTLPD